MQHYLRTYVIEPESASRKKAQFLAGLGFHHE
jgi:hypothetical protein